MAEGFRQRLVGATVLVALAVVFLPMLLTGPVERTRVDVAVDLPPPPELAPVEAPPPRDQLDDAPGPGSEALSRPEPSGEQGADLSAPADDEVRSQPDPVAEPEQTRSDAARDPDTAPAPPVAEGDAPASESAPRAVGEFAVQVGAFGREENALGLRDRLREAGLPAFVEPTGNDMHRVQLGPVATRDDAEGLARRAREQMDLDGIVVTR